LFEIYWTFRSESDFNQLKSNPSQNKHYKAVKKTIELLASDPHHQSLQTHEFTSLKGPNSEKVFEAYAEQNSPSAYRVFWYYSPAKSQITIFAITKHP
jgi:glycine cleavage system aminomethyltransferase T